LIKSNIRSSGIAKGVSDHAFFIISQKTEVRSQKTEVRSQKSEDRSQKSEDGRQKKKDGKRKMMVHIYKMLRKISEKRYKLLIIRG